MKKNKIYIDVDENNSVINIFSDYFQEPEENNLINQKTFLIAEGYGDGYIHAQNFLGSLFTIYGQPVYYYRPETKRVVVRNEEDLNTLYPIVPTPTDLDRLDARISYLEMITEPVANVMSVSAVAEGATTKSFMFNKLKYYYDTKLWTAEMIQLAVTYKRITQAECDEILSLQSGGEIV